MSLPTTVQRPAPRQAKPKVEAPPKPAKASIGRIRASDGITAEAFLAANPIVQTIAVKVLPWIPSTPSPWRCHSSLYPTYPGLETACQSAKTRSPECTCKETPCEPIS